MDKQLIEGLRINDASSIRTFVSTYQDAIYQQAYRLLGNAQDAEEACQDIFVKTIKNIDGFRQESKLSTWLYRIAYTTCIDRLNKKAIQPDGEWNESALPADWHTINTALVDLAQAEQRHLIDNALSQLNEIDALLLDLFHLRDHTIQEIENITGMANSAVKVRLFRARKKLADVLMNSLPHSIIKELSDDSQHLS